MTRLQSELQRLYLPRSTAHAEAGASPVELIDAANQVRAMVLELRRPASWELLSRAWHGVQTELGLPAPAIAVSGSEGLQLWFSLAEPVAIARAHAFLDALRMRFLPEVKTSRIAMLPLADAAVPREQGHARLVPSLQQPSGNWSAFVAPDLAPIFGDAPWLDIAPSEDGQAALLSGLQTLSPVAFDAAMAQLGPRTVAASVTDERGASTLMAQEDPQRFLLRVMNDESVTLALRIEAAKALLQHATDHRSRHSGD